MKEAERKITEELKEKNIPPEKIKEVIKEIIQSLRE
jgi:hypothetical protein